MPMPNTVYVGPNIHKHRLIQQALCTCPWCHVVWAHYETPGQPTFDLQKTRELLGKPTDIWTCPTCHEDSKADSLREHRVRVQKVQERSR